MKIYFRLTRQEDGYPPADSESMWAVSIGDNRYRLDNIPFFACGVSRFDVVSASTSEDGTLWFRDLVEVGGHSTLRVIFYEDSNDHRPLTQRIRDLSDVLRQHGCQVERSHLPGLLSIDVPSGVSLESVISLLEDGNKRGLWDYEEAALAHPE